MTNELDQLARDLIDLSRDFQNGKPAKKFMNHEGAELRKKTLALAKTRINRKTGNLSKGIRKGKVYKWKSTDMAIRVFGGKPAYHAHLLEYGHRVIYKDGREIKIPGKYFFRDAIKGYENQFVDNCTEFAIDLCVKHGMR